MYERRSESFGKGVTATHTIVDFSLVLHKSSHLLAVSNEDLSLAGLLCVKFSPRPSLLLYVFDRRRIKYLFNSKRIVNANH